MTVIDHPAARLADVMRWVTGHNLQLLVSWAPQESPQVNQVVAAYQTANPGLPVIAIGHVDFQDALQSFWLEADDMIDSWQPPPLRAKHEIPADRTVYLQKSGTAGDHDVFDVRRRARMGTFLPCTMPTKVLRV
jgi:hypothetical protein